MTTPPTTAPSPPRPRFLIIKQHDWASVLATASAAKSWTAALLWPFDCPQIQITRAVGVAIVKNGCMVNGNRHLILRPYSSFLTLQLHPLPPQYPTMELLLRHAIQYLGLRGKSVVANPGVLDNEEEFMAELQV